MSRHEARQKLALEFGATDIVTERGDEGVARIKELTDGLGAHSVIEAVGTQESMMQAIRSTRAGGHVGFVGVTHGVELPGMDLFFSHVHLHGGPAPVRRFLPDLIELIGSRHIDPGKVFDLTLPLDQAAEGYRAMDERRAIKIAAAPVTDATEDSTRSHSQRIAAASAGPAEYFTGDVYIDVQPLFAEEHAAAYGGAYVSFAPGARIGVAHAPGRAAPARDRGRRPYAAVGAAAWRRSEPGTCCGARRASSTGTAPPRPAR